MKRQIDEIKTWFITGGSSGIGKEICRQLLEKGHNVIAVSRRVPDFENENALNLYCDVTDPKSIKIAIEKGIETFGKIDVICNNAGIGANSTLEEIPSEHLRYVMETNFFGAFNVIQAILPHFRENKNGTIINNTSKSGLAHRKFGSAYCSSKHALEALTSVARLETQSFCRVMAFELGFFPGTDIANNRLVVETQIDEYKDAPFFEIDIPINYHNDFHKAVEILIETVYNETLPRYLILGEDACKFTEYVIKRLSKCLNGSKIYNKKVSLKDKNDTKFVEHIFSVKNMFKDQKKYKIIRLFGIKIKIKQAETVW